MKMCLGRFSSSPTACTGNLQFEVIYFLVKDSLSSVFFNYIRCYKIKVSLAAWPAASSPGQVRFWSLCLCMGVVWWTPKSSLKLRDEHQSHHWIKTQLSIEKESVYRVPVYWANPLLISSLRWCFLLKDSTAFTGALSLFFLKLFWTILYQGCMNFKKEKKKK